jgi:hypothetical protein
MHDELNQPVSTHTQTILTALLDEIRSTTRQIQCGAPAATIQEHTAMLYEIRADIKNVVNTVNELKDDLKEHKNDIYDKVNEHSLSLTEIKSEKKTAIAIGGVVVGLIWQAYTALKGFKP